jgi:hypothetical protein
MGRPRKHDPAQDKPKLGDELQGTWRREELEQMDAAFRRAVRRALLRSFLSQVCPPVLKSQSSEPSGTEGNTHGRRASGTFNTAG